MRKKWNKIQEKYNKKKQKTDDKEKISKSRGYCWKDDVRFGKIK